VYARAHALHYGIGVPMRKVPTILRELCGVAITQSAIQQDALRRSQEKVGEKYERLREGVKEAKRVFTDDTGWRINGETAYLRQASTRMRQRSTKSAHAIATKRCAKSFRRITVV